MKKNKILFIVIAGVLAVQGCTVNVTPAAGAPGVYTHTPVVPLEGVKGTGDSEGNDQGSEGEDGIHAPQPQAGIGSQSAQLMGRSAQVAPPEAGSALPHLNAEERRPKSDSAFDSKFWAGVFANTVAPAIAPAIVGALFKQ